ncbi:amidase [Ferruginivarius sediminum]|uniref:Amidase n=1 Tax=Ferruginivarius sediminum TaxID=2661937 RepID=A0A369TDT7_9PROT|nr:amidase [Ferruginivarius sediminum]RDD61086.1 amidase [Ferruginivarius sediminum]
MHEANDSIAALGRAYRNGHRAPVEVVRGCFERIAAVEPALNAWITRDAEAALATAEQLGRELEAGCDRGPLHGVPVAIKDLMDVRGQPTTFGSSISPEALAGRDATLVGRLRAAGAVLMGKTNCLEYGYGIAHPAVGQTFNPWNTSQTAGGSSGGSAAAVAAGQVWGATGTDSGGSIRIPAAYCGVVGLKPTYGLVPLGGVQPLSWSLDHAGPIARTCADAACLLSLMATRDVRPIPRDLEGLRLAVIREHAEDTDLQEDVGHAFEEALSVLSSRGAVIRRVSVPDLAHADDALTHVMAPEASVVHAERLAARAEDFAEQTRVQLETGFALPATAHVRAQRYRRHIGRQLRELLEEADALVSPTVPWTAPTENPPLDDPVGAAEMRYIAPYNLTGLPALTLPCGLGENGMPVGFQLAAPPDFDGELLAIGAALETIFPPLRPTACEGSAAR